MKNILKSVKVIAIILVTLFVNNSCSNLLDNPLKDKETGDDITLILLDLNFFDTKLNFYFVEEGTDELVIDKTINVTFDGASATNIVGYDGFKSDDYNVKNGKLELAYDPNIDVNENIPIEFTTYIYTEGFAYHAFPKETYLTQTGDYDIIIELIPIEKTKSAQSHLKSASTILKPGEEPFDVKFNNKLIQAEDNPMWTTFRQKGPFQDGKKYYTMYGAEQTSAGTLTSSNFSRDILQFSNWGIEGIFQANGKKSQSFDLTNKDVKVEANLKYFMAYSAVVTNNTKKCYSGININIKEKNGSNGTGKFKYSITIDNEIVVSGKISGASIPIKSNTGAFYYQEGATSAILKITGDGQYDLSPSEITINNFCGASVDITATPKNGLVQHHIITSFVCLGKPAGYAPSINGQFKEKGSSDVWTYFKFKEGIADLWFKPGATYTVKGSMNDETATFDLPTDISKIDAVIAQIKLEQPDINDIKINISDNKNGIKTIRVEVFFKEGKCMF